MEPQQLPLKDIHLPAPVGWWPPAIGWWLLALFLIAAIWLGYWWYRRSRRQTAVKAAQNLLTELKQELPNDTAKVLRNLSVLMRRVAISVFPRAEVAGLTGNHWLQFLDRVAGGNAFQSDIGRLLIAAPYQQTAPSESEISQLLKLCEDWLNLCAKRKS